MKKIKKLLRVKNNGVFYVVIALIAILAVGTGIYAYSVSNNVNVEGDYNYYESEAQSVEAPDIEFGAFPGGDIYQDVIFHQQMLGIGVNQPIGVPPTSTSNVAEEDATRDLRASVAYWTNTTGKTLICDNVRLPILTGTGTWTFSYGVGTTTKISSSPSWTNTTTETLIASTTAANTFDVDANLFNDMTNWGNPGSYYTVGSDGAPTTTEFNLTNGTSIVAWFKTIDATSTDSFVKGSGHNLTGSLLANCYPARY